MDTDTLNKKVSQYDDAYMYQKTPKQHLEHNSWKS